MKSLTILIIFLSMTFFLIGQPNIIFEDDFESGTFSSQWNLSSSDTNGFIIIENGRGLDNSFGVVMGKSFDGNTFTTNALDLNLDLTGQTDVKLSFFIADNFDETQQDDGLFLSDDGGITFHPALDFRPSEWCNFYGKLPPIDIAKLAGELGLELNNQFAIRFQQTGTDDFSDASFSGQDGFFIDNIVVYNENIVYDSLPFFDDFNTNSYKPSWSWEFADETVSIITPNNPTSNMNFVGVRSLNFTNSTPVLFMGRRCDGLQTTNAFDLHLDLSSEADVEMTFWIADNDDVTQNDDGLYFSDDGGLTFHSVLKFNPSEWCNPSGDFLPFFGKHPPIDIDELASDAGLSLTDNFVIRFQQVGDRNFNNNSFSGRNGFFLDDVNVYNPNLIYENLPFEDNFETGDFRDNWAWNFADKTVEINTNSEITSPMSFVGVVDNFGHNGSTYAAWIGKRCDGVFTTNALDLHLNMLNQSNVNMTFWIADHYDETQIDDGVYLSNNAGESFEKIFDFDFSNTQDLAYQFYELNIDSLANEAQLSLDERMVIRFQQTGQSDFNTFNGGNGIFLDDIQVFSITTSLNELEETVNFSLFPNPVDDYLNLTFTDTESRIKNIQVLTIEGKIILSKNINTDQRLDVSNLNKGIFIVSLITETGKVYHRKIIKE